MNRVFVAAGSNDQPERRLRCGALALRGCYGELRCSPVYRNPAHGAAAPDYLNLVIAFETPESATDLVANLKQIERECGREDGTVLCALDLDLVLYGDDSSVESAPGWSASGGAELLGHPWVLGPLAILAPERRHPFTGLTFREQWQGVDPSVRNALQEVRLPGL